jgi:hypothetical protein
MLAVAAKSLDEVTSVICDAYDALIAPKRIYRNDNNRLYLFFRACAAGIKLLLDIVLALRHRFDPRLCSDEDLFSTTKLVGTDFQKGSGSAVRITVANSHPLESRTLQEGTYNYTSVTGMVFSFYLPMDVSFPPATVNTVSAVSREKGSFQVGDNALIKLTRDDGRSIDKSFKFSCENNASSLGYPDEDAVSFRRRVLSGEGQQDHIKELELKIKSLPNIFECGLTFNPGDEDAEYDGVVLAPLELLVTITGTPSSELAELVVRDVIYSTHKVDPANVVYYYNSQYVNGRYPVYFRYHEKADFSLEIEYQYSSQKMKKAGVEAEFDRLLGVYKGAVVHQDIIRKTDIDERLAKADVPNVTVLSVDLIVNGEKVPYFRVPSTRIHNLVETTYLSTDTLGEES